MMEDKISRRGFLKRLGGFALAASPMAAAVSSVSTLTSCCEPKRGTSPLVILHTNDVHSHIDPFPATDPRYAGLGGYARRASIIEDAIREYGADNVMVFESGDMFQGTPYFNFYKGKLEIQLMNMMHVDAVTIGNHEFDNGVDSLCDCMEMANFPFLSANYVFTDARGSKLVKPYKVFERAGFRIGVFGLGVQLKGLVAPVNCDTVKYEPLVETAQKVVDSLRNDEKCDIVIALTHIGHNDGPEGECDVMLAQRTHGIDLILGGHSHTFLPAPEQVNNILGKTVFINQVGFGGINVGKIEINRKEDNMVSMACCDNIQVK